MTDPERAQRALPFLDLSQLKFRERDDLEAIFKAWRRADDKAFDVRRLWDERMRLYLKTRYDARANVADWDYNMRLFVHAPMVHPKHYEHWRETGVAFDPRDAPYDHVNRTLASEAPAREQGRKARRCNAYFYAGFHNNTARRQVLKRGYWGDISTGPYIAFGTHSEDPAMLAKQNARHTKVSVYA